MKLKKYIIGSILGCITVGMILMNINSQEIKTNSPNKMEDNKQVEQSVLDEKVEQKINLSGTKQIEDEQELGRSYLSLNEGYKLFYGEWEIIEVSEGMEDRLGEKVVFKEDLVQCGDRIISREPIYHIRILHTYKTLWTYYSNAWKRLEQLDGQPYYIVIDGYSGENKDFTDALGCDVLLVDENTIIGGDFVLKRVKHLENVEQQDTSSSHQVIQGGENEYVNNKALYRLPDGLTNGRLNGRLKLFYGDWIVKRILDSSSEGKNKTIDQSIQNLLGSTINLTHNEVRINEKCIATQVYYQTSIYPVTGDKNQTYTKNLPLLRELGITGKIFAFIEIQSFKPNEVYNGPFKYFYIKDKDTLIAEEQGYYIELKRTTPISDDRYEYEWY